MASPSLRSTWAKGTSGRYRAATHPASRPARSEWARVASTMSHPQDHTERRVRTTRAAVSPASPKTDTQAAISAGCRGGHCPV